MTGFLRVLSEPPATTKGSVRARAVKTWVEGWIGGGGGVLSD